MKYLILLSFILIGNISVAQPDNILHQLLSQNPKYFQNLSTQPEKFQVQIIYTQINRDENNHPHFTSYSYGLTDKYYYPASTVKMPAAFLALEKFNQLSIIGLEKNSSMKVGAGTPPQTAVTSDSTTQNLQASIAHYIKKIFLVSDNDAFNRLYEFLGQEYLNKKLHEKGYDNSRIVHRLSVGGFDVEGNRHTNPVSFYQGDTLLYHQGEVYSQFNADLKLKNEVRGIAYLGAENKIIDKPFDFRAKNYVSLQDQHDMLKAVIFPEAVKEHERFDLTDEDYAFLYEWMAKLPRNSDYPAYNEPDNYVKFFMEGQDTSFVIPENIRILNKVGWAYGFLTDVSYIADLENQVEFFLVANIHVNDNLTYNDGVYEYETIGLPFFAHLGRVIFEHEKKRKKKFLPNLNKFK